MAIGKSSGINRQDAHHMQQLCSKTRSQRRRDHIPAVK